LVGTPTLEGENVLLKSTVVREDVYQRQQGEWPQRQACVRELS
jgi:hypothetical protein